MNTTPQSSPIFAFWQMVVMVTLGFGGILFATDLLLEKPLGLTHLTMVLTTGQLALYVVGFGTGGLHMFKDRWQAQGRLGAVRRFAIWTPLVMFVASMGVDLHPIFGSADIEQAIGHIAVGSPFIMIALAHIYLPTFNPKAAEPDTEATSGE